MLRLNMVTPRVGFRLMDYLTPSALTDTSAGNATSHAEALALAATQGVAVAFTKDVYTSVLSGAVGGNGGGGFYIHYATTGNPVITLNGDVRAYPNLVGATIVTTSGTIGTVGVVASIGEFDGTRTSVTLVSGASMDVSFKFITATLTGVVGNIPVPLARPTADDVTNPGDGITKHQYGTGYGFDIDGVAVSVLIDSNYTTYGTYTKTSPQQIVVYFKSDVVGLAELSMHGGQVDSATFPSAPGFGRCTGANIKAANWYSYTVAATLNAVTSAAALKFLGSSGGNEVCEGNAPYGFFTWQWFTDSSTYATAKRHIFPLVRGINTITIEPGASGSGVILDGLFIRLVRDKSADEPVCLTPDSSPVINGAAVLSKLSSTPCNVVYMGDSITTGSNTSGFGYLNYFRDQLATRYAPTAYGYKLGTDTVGQDETAWQPNPGSPAVTITRPGSGSASVEILVGVNGWKWTSAQNGSGSTISTTFTGSYWKVVYCRSTASDSFKVTVDGVDVATVATASASVNFGSVEGTCAAGSHTIVLTKVHTGAADGLTLAFLVLGDSANHIAYRIAKGGTSTDVMFPSNTVTKWADLMTTLGTTLIFHENVNWSSSNSSLWDKFGVPLENAMNAITRNGAATYCFVSCFKYAEYSAGQSAPLWTVGEVKSSTYCSATATERRLIDRNRFGLLPQTISVVDLEQWVGWPNIDTFIYNTPAAAGSVTIGSVKVQGRETQTATSQSAHGMVESYASHGTLAADLLLGNVPLAAASTGGGGAIVGDPAKPNF